MIKAAFDYANTTAFTIRTPIPQVYVALIVVLASIAFVLGKQLLLHIWRNNLIRVKFHRIRRTAFRDTSKLRDVLEHIGKRDLGAHYLHVTTLGQLGNHAASAIDVADDIAHGLLWNGHVHLHERLHQLGTSLAQALARRPPR